MALNVSGSKALYWKTGIDNTGLKKGSKQATGILAGLAKNVSGLDVFAGLAISAGIAFTKISRKAYTFSKSFETAMKEVQTISGAVQNDFDGISDQIVQLSKDVPELATSLTKAYYQIVSAGYDGAKGMELLEVASKLAVAGVTDTFTAADTLTSIMNAYGDRAGSAMEISDKLFTVVKLGKTNMSELGHSLSQVTGLAAQAGVEFDDLMAIVAKGTKTIKADKMIVGIKGMLTAIISGPTDEAISTIDNLGDAFSLGALKSKGFTNFMADLIEITGGSIESLQSLFPNVRGLTGLLAVATEEGGKFSDALEEVVNSTGATEEAFKVMVNTADAQLKILQNNVNAKLKTWGDTILKSVNSVAGSINKAFSQAGEGYTNNVEKAIGEGFRLQSNFESISSTLIMLASKQKKTNFEAQEYSKIIDTMNTQYAPYLANLISEEDSYKDIADNLAIAKTNLEEYWKAKRKEAVTKDLQKEMDLLNKRNSLLQYTLDLHKAGKMVIDEEHGGLLSQESTRNNINKAIEKNNYLLEGLKDRYKQATGAITDTDNIILTLVEDFGKTKNAGTGAAKEIEEAFTSGIKGISEAMGKGFDLTYKPMDFSVEKQSLSEIMSMFNQHISQLEALRQAGVDTTGILSAEWENFYANVQVEYENDQMMLDAVLNMKKDAEAEYFEWRKQQWQEQNEFENGILQVGLEGYRTFVNSMIDVEMTGKERREAIWETVKSGFINLLANMTAKLIENAIINAVIGKASETAAVASSAVTGSLIAGNYATAAAMASLASFGANSIPASAGITGTVALAQGMAKFMKFNEGGELNVGSDRNVDSVPVYLTKKEIIINRESSQANNGFNRKVLLGINQDKDFIQKNFMPKNAGGELGGFSSLRFPQTTFPNRMEITSTQLGQILGAIKAQTMNQQRRGSAQPIVNIQSSFDLERFTIKQDETREQMTQRGYVPNA